VKSVLVIGGAGFIGSHTVDALLERGYRVRVLDKLEPQVHAQCKVPSYLSSDAELIVGDVRDRCVLERALEGVDSVIYLAALVGVAQSMYEISRYVQGNTGAAADFLEFLMNRQIPLERLVVASSMSAYGEGSYECDECGIVHPDPRPTDQLASHSWELVCASCGSLLRPMPTSETTSLRPTSIYAITKRDHEELFMTVGQAYGIPTVALRYFNVYGPRQALSNPYTGVAAIFSSRILNGHAPIIYEDGGQSRDFVNVRDLARANVLALQCPAAVGQVFNVGTGQAVTVGQIAQLLGDRLGFTEPPSLPGSYREGDIRHCIADISKIQRMLGYEPQISFAEGVDDLISWVRTQSAEDRVDSAHAELVAHGLVH